MSSANLVFVGSSRVRPGARGWVGVLVVGLLAAMVVAGWVPAQERGVWIAIRTADGSPVPMELVDHAQTWLASDTALFCALESLRDVHPTSPLDETAALRGMITVDAPAGNDGGQVARVRFRGRIELGQLAARRLAEQFADHEVGRLSDRHADRAAMLRAGLNHTRIEMRRLSDEVDQLGREIASLHGSLRAARLAGIRHSGKGHDSAALRERHVQAVAIGKKLEYRGERLRQLGELRRQAESIDQQLHVVGRRQRELAGVRLVTEPIHWLQASKYFALAAVLTVLVGAAAAGGRKGVCRRRAQTVQRLSQARFDLGVPVVSVGLARCGASS